MTMTNCSIAEHAIFPESDAALLSTMDSVGIALPCESVGLFLILAAAAYAAVMLGVIGLVLAIRDARRARRGVWYRPARSKRRRSRRCTI